MNGDYHGATKAPTSRKIDSCFGFYKNVKDIKADL